MGYVTSDSRMYVEEIKQETRTEGNDNKSLETNISFKYKCFINKQTSASERKKLKTIIFQQLLMKITSNFGQFRTFLSRLQ